MNNIVNLSQLITQLAKTTDTDPNTARRFLRTFFAAIEDDLAEGRVVVVPGIGTFRRCDDPTVGIPGRVGFAPDPDFAAEINRPFAGFEAVELADGVTEADLAAIPDDLLAKLLPQDETPDPAPEDTLEDISSAPKVEETIVADIAPVEAPVAAEAPVEAVEPVAEAAPESVVIPPAIEEEIPSVTEPQPVPASEPKMAEMEEPAEKPRHKLSWIWVAAVAIAAAAVIGYVVAILTTPMPTYGDDDDYQAEIETVAADTIAVSQAVDPVVAENETESEAAVQKGEPEKVVEEVAPASAKKPVYDTISTTRYLSKMAREYYGRSIFWVFIYDANADILDNPDKIAPGTRILIPDKDSLPGKTLDERQAIAERRKAEIMAKYK